MISREYLNELIDIEAKLYDLFNNTEDSGIGMVWREAYKLMKFMQNEINVIEQNESIADGL